MLQLNPPAEPGHSVTCSSALQTSRARHILQEFDEFDEIDAFFPESFGNVTDGMLSRFMSEFKIFTI